MRNSFHAQYIFAAYLGYGTLNPVLYGSGWTDKYLLLGLIVAFIYPFLVSK